MDIHSKSHNSSSKQKNYHFSLTTKKKKLNSYKRKEMRNFLCTIQAKQTRNNGSEKRTAAMRQKEKKQEMDDITEKKNICIAFICIFEAKHVTMNKGKRMPLFFIGLMEKGFVTEKKKLKGTVILFSIHL